MASPHGDGTAEIPQLVENVGFDVLGKHFGEDETEIKRGVLTLKVKMRRATVAM